MFLKNSPVVAASFVLSSSVLGLCANGFILYNVLVKKVFGKAFGRIWISRGIAYIVLCSFFALYLAPTTIIDADFLFTTSGRRLLYAMVFIGNTVLGHTLLVAINRCVIITLPLRYKNIFSLQCTNIHITLAWIICALANIPSMMHPCHPTILESDQPFVFGKPECGLLVNVLEITVPTVIMGVTVVVDLFTLYKIGDVLKIRDKLTNPVGSRRHSKQREVRLCCMILTQVIFGVFVYFTVTIGNFIEQEFIQFLATTFMWSTAQLVDAVIVILFVREMNSDVRHRLSSTLSKPIPWEGHIVKQVRRTTKTFTQFCALEHLMFLRNVPIVAAALILIAGVLGIVVNAFVLYAVLVKKVFGRVFGRIWISRGVAYIVLCSMFIFYLAPAIAIDTDFLFSTWGRRILHISMFFCNVVLAHTLLIAINRCVIITLPLRYKRIFSPLCTYAFIALSWIVCAACMAPSIIDPCHPTIIESEDSLIFGRPECGLFVNIVDISLPTVNMGATVIVDIFSIFKVRDIVRVRQKLSERKIVRRRCQGSEAKLCAMILVQVVVAIFVYFTITFGTYIENEFLQFLATTFTWCMAQFLDGLIVVIFIQEINSGMRHRLSSTISTITTIRNVSSSSSFNKKKAAENGVQKR
ncbi:hypothetical protein QR680_007124 [Steinernema hermaphroditum]|uniref:G-protein coupled receptors family 1 profile domain-containing protein n=1 Tax=Steinernema hermaphroditum TaxID=289476 RepID=A0AA39HZE2_9BILA|nr:hypothetical protein QR680_007124 [Steinernema hermaphroditum]